VVAAQLGDHGAAGDAVRGEQVGRAVPDMLVAVPLRDAGHRRQHRLGPVQRLVMPDFSSTHSTTAPLRRSWYSPTTSTTVSANSGSEDSLNVPVKCGLISNLGQVRIQQDRRRPARPRLIAQPIQPLRGEPLPPLAHRHRIDPQIRGGLLV
jgi:hypothetical protein